MNRRELLTTAAAAMVLPGSPLLAQDAVSAPEVIDYALGNPDAKVKIIEYASLTCPHCAQFHRDVFKPLRADYIETGKVHFTLREVYFDKFGLWGAMLARCAGEARYFGITDILFETQAEWLGAGETGEVIGNLKRIGRTAGLEDAAIEACFNDDAMAEAMVAAFQEKATADAIEGTPTFIINGEKYSNMSYADLKAIIDPLLSE